MDHAIAYFLELRLRFRRNPDARAIVDRCLALVAQAHAHPGRIPDLERQVEMLRAELVACFGERPVLTRH